MRIGLSTPVHAYIAATNPLSGLWRHAPAKLVAAVVFLVTLGTLITQLKPTSSFFGAVFKLAARPFRSQDKETKYRIHRRRLFARHIQSQLQLIATGEDWHDERFADLEAEVEVEGRQRTMPWLRYSPARTVVLRREKSLSRALERSVEPLVVLEGDPGAGKSVALRHLAERLVDKARRSREISIIPLYINLKEFRPERRPVDSNSVYDFILASINRGNDRDVERFLDQEFDRGLEDGSWLILLDSFDEIPDVLSSTEADNVVEEYALAIHNFLFGMHRSRAIVASREFRGPNSFRVPRFRVVALSGRRKADLIRRSGLNLDEVRIVEGGLAVADQELRQMAANPMFLSLICEYARAAGGFPDDSHSVYESYLTQRFDRDAERMQRRYKVGAKLVRAMAEEIAFSMAAMPGLGLSPTRQALHAALIDTDQSIAKLDAVFGALEYTKLGRAVEDTDGSGQSSFTFAHRRFQEYFATCVVIRDPERVSVTDLLTDGHWRETAVTILQTQPTTAIARLLGEATNLLAPMTRKTVEDEGLRAASGGYCWPLGAMHLLGVLSAGLGRAPDNIPSEFRADAGVLLLSAWNNGRRHDRKWAVNLALVARRDDTIRLLEEAFGSGSVLLGGAAYACVSSLADPSPSLYEGARKALVEMAASGDLREQKVAIGAQVRRLSDPLPLIQVLRLLIAAPRVDLLLAVIQSLICVSLDWRISLLEIPLAVISLTSYQPMLSRNVPYHIPATHLNIRPDYFTSVLIAMYCRVMASSLTIGAAFNVQPRNRLLAPGNLMLAAITIAVGLLFVFWLPTVGYACKHRYKLSVFMWPFIPLFALVSLLRTMMVKVKKVMADAKKIPISTLAARLVGILIVGVSVWGAIKYIPSHTSGRISAIVRLPAVVIFVVILAFEPVRFLPRYILRRRRDIRLVDRFFSNDGQFTVTRICGALYEIKTERGIRLFVESALRIDPIAYPEMIRTLSDIAATAEVKRKGPGAIVASGVTPEFADWFKGHAGGESRAPTVLFVIRSLPATTLDQIARAAEQTEVARGSAPSQANE